MCKHDNLTYDATLGIVRCMDCDWWQDADEPIPPVHRGAAARSPVTDAANTNTPSKDTDICSDQ